MGASLFGGHSANAAARREAQRNRDFQMRMSSTAHQREVRNLRMAGLNPILSATGGRGASTPGGSMAQQKDIGTPAANSAMQARRLQQEIKNMKAVELKDIALKDKAEIDQEVSLASARHLYNQAHISMNDKYRSDREFEMYNSIYSGDGGLLLYGLNQGQGAINSAAGIARAGAALRTSKFIPKKWNVAPQVPRARIGNKSYAR